jgi:UDP-N-acetylglucosamine kinase
MKEIEAKAWVKDRANQDKVVTQFFKDFKPSKVKQAFFMAGIPGSGKTEFAENTINIASPILVPIEHDKLVEYIHGYSPENYYVFRKAGSTLVSRILKECLKHGYGFIFDGTLSSPQGVSNINAALKQGYYVIVVYIVQDILKAWNLTQDRELVKKRAI